MSTSWPFERNWPQISARRSHATQAWYSVRSPFAPRYSFVATEKVCKAQIALTPAAAHLSRRLGRDRSWLIPPQCPHG